MLRFLMAPVRNLRPPAMLVLLLSGRKSITSRRIRRTCERPFLGGMNFSTTSLKKMTPTLSLFLRAEKARTAQSSAAVSRFSWRTVPKSPEPLTSTRRITVSSRSSSKTFTKGWLNRAETFQSIDRMSSPNWYSRTSLKAMPRPLKTLWYSPEKIWLTNPLVRISIARTFFSSSAVSMITSRPWARAPGQGTSTAFRMSSMICSEVTFSASAS